MIADGSEPGITADCERAHVKEHRIPYTEAYKKAATGQLFCISLHTSIRISI